MIKGPYKYDTDIVKLTSWFGIAVASIMVGYETKIVEWTLSVHIPTVILALLTFTVFFAIGKALSYKSRQLFHTVVKNPIFDVKELEVGTTYYLNGMTKAIYFLNDSDNSGRYIFEVEGIREDILLTPIQVKTYLSKRKEN